MPSPTQESLEDLKKRARRRLVGAIVLVIIAVIVLPILFESDPKPVGEDVQIQIPPIDDGKFVSKLPPLGKREAPAKTEKALPKPPEHKSPVTPAKENVTSPPKDKSTVTDSFVVQLASYSEEAKARDLQTKLERDGFNAFIEPIETSKGPLFRVRVGPYSGREAAEAAHGKLKSQGYSGIVAAAK